MRFRCSHLHDGAESKVDSAPRLGLSCLLPGVEMPANAAQDGVPDFPHPPRLTPAQDGGLPLWLHQRSIYVAFKHEDV
jgi:hypothetical protein